MTNIPLAEANRAELNCNSKSWAHANYSILIVVKPGTDAAEMLFFI